MDIIKVTKALSDPTRLKIINIIKENQDDCELEMKSWSCVCVFKKHFNMSQPTLTYHMKLLEDANLITSTRKGKYTLYKINHETLDAVIEYFEVLNEK